MELTEEWPNKRVPSGSLVGVEAALLRRDRKRNKKSEDDDDWDVVGLVTIERETETCVVAGMTKYVKPSFNAVHPFGISRKYEATLSFEPTLIAYGRQAEADKRRALDEAGEKAKKRAQWKQEPGPKLAGLIVSRIGSGHEEFIIEKLAKGLTVEELQKIATLLE